MAGRAPRSRQQPVVTRCARRRAAGLVVPRHRVLRAGARCDACRRSRPGDRAAERDAVRSHRWHPLARRGRGRALARRRARSATPTSIAGSPGPSSSASRSAGGSDRRSAAVRRPVGPDYVAEMVTAAPSIDRCRRCTTGRIARRGRTGSATATIPPAWRARATSSATATSTESWSGSAPTRRTARSTRRAARAEICGTRVDRVRRRRPNRTTHCCTPGARSVSSEFVC